MIAVEARPADVREDIFSTLDRLTAAQPEQRGMPFPRYAEQWVQLQGLAERANSEPAAAPILLEYAAHPGSSLLMRAYALDIGIAASRRAVEGVARGGPAASAAQVEICDQVRRVAPEYFDPAVRGELNELDELGPRLLGRGYFFFFDRLAVREGIDSRLVRPNHDDLGYPPEDIATNVPAAASILLRRLVGGEDALDINHLSPRLASAALELALDFRSPAYQQAVVDGRYSATVEHARLWPLAKAWGEGYDEPLDALYDWGDEGVPYAEALRRLSDTVTLLTELYPYIPADAMIGGVRRLVAKVLLGIQFYREHGNDIDTTIAFPGGQPIHVREQNPLELIQLLTPTFEKAHYAVTNLRPEFGAGNANFHHCRFVDDSGQVVPTVSYHGRPYGGQDFDPAYEFTGDATGRLRVQHSGDRPISFLNAEQTADTVGFRVDFDRFGLALDIGALWDNPYTDHPHDLEVRMGRFLALGDYLYGVQMDRQPTMHHVRGLRLTAAELSAGIAQQEQKLRARASAGATALAARG
jgi:hypothetical protein